MILQRKTRCAALAVVAGAAISGGGAAAQLLDSAVDKLVQEQVETALLDALAGQLEGDLERALDAAGAGALDGAAGTLSRTLARVQEIAPTPDAPFAAALDDEGFAIEDGVWVILATPERLKRIQRQGFVVREQRRLPGLNRVLLRVEAPTNRSLIEAAIAFEEAVPGTPIDHNHLYRTDGAPAPRGDAAGAAGRNRPGGPAQATPPAHRGPSVGIVDSTVSREHEALRGADIVQRDFVPFARPRPEDHGTAVASIVVGDSAKLKGALRGSRLYAGAVFFEDDNGNSAATASSVVQALDWVIASGVDVVNMSLSGPPNRILEAAIAGAIERGAVVVAAVGNAGPASPPLYPAAYSGVVGVTALDDALGVYRYANRGPQVTFAAPGVAVPVARGDGSYGRESGTSMAAPHAASIIARALAASRRSPARVLSALEAAARDLGEAGFDETFGHGLILAPE